MDSQPPQPGEYVSKSRRLVGGTSNMSLIGTQQECRHWLVHCDTANTANKHITQGEHSKIAHKTGRNKNKKLHAVGSDYTHIEVNGRQWTV